jgi:hypothetical protein
MAHGSINVQVTGRPEPMEYQMGDYGPLMEYNQYRLRRTRTDLTGDIQAPELRLEGQTEKSGHRFGFRAEFSYDPTPGDDGLPWGFRLRTGQIWTMYHGPSTFTDTSEWHDTIRDGEDKFYRKLSRESIARGEGYLTPAPPGDTSHGGLRFGGRQVLRESIRESIRDIGTLRWTIFITDETYFHAAEEIECVCCGDDISPLDAATGKPLEFDGDPFCITCWVEHTAQENGVDPSEVTSPETFPRYLLLHAGFNGPAHVEAVQIDSANPYRSTDSGTYDFVRQEWICSAPRTDNDQLQVCGTFVTSTNPSAWSRCPACGNYLVMT